MALDTQRNLDGILTKLTTKLTELQPSLSEQNKQVKYTSQMHLAFSALR
jgi:hypothetical protein